MFPLIPFIFLAYFVLYVLAGDGTRHSYHLEKTDLGPQISLDAWLSSEKKIALHKLLENVSPGGSNAAGAVPGTVIASPSKSQPDYYFQWIRDAGIVLGSLLNFYTDERSAFSQETITPILESYATLSSKLQHTNNPSGSWDNLAGLGEPKFHTDGTPFTGNWGRPQHDGPALRAITLMSYLRHRNSSHPELWISYLANGYNPYGELYNASLPANSVIKADLEYISRYYTDTAGFDLWEEQRGLHFFTSMVQLRALREGAELAERFRDHGAAEWYSLHAKNLSSSMQRFVDMGRLVSTIGTQRSGLDCSILLGALHGHSESSENESPFSPHSDEVLNSLLYLAEDQATRFPINEPAVPFKIRGASHSQHPLASDATSNPFRLNGLAIGRYPEDTYNGYDTASLGNPWFLCTSTASSILFRTRARISSAKLLTVTEQSLPFWNALLDDAVVPGSFTPDDEMFKTALAALKRVGDEFLSVVRKHTSGEGSMAEQIDRVTGVETGARDLTWSYAAFLDAVRDRDASVGR